MSIQEILGTDVIKDSRAVINANFTHLEDTKATGPASATDNAIARYDATTGKLLQDSTVTIGDTGAIVTTIPDAANVVGLTINQNDVTNNPVGLRVINAGTGNSISAESTASLALIELYRSETAGGNAGAILFNQNNSTGVKKQTGSIYSYFTSNTNGSENSVIELNTTEAGAFGPQLRVNDGVNGISVGSTTAAGVISSRGNQDLTLQTGNATTGDITITDGANGDIDITPHGTGEINLNNTVNPAAGFSATVRPSVDGGYSLGSSSFAWSDLYLDGFMLGNNGIIYAKNGTTELLRTTNTASAVNELGIANAATGNSPTISATGNDTNIGITLTPKGTGAVVADTNTLRVTTAKTPASATAAGTAGDIAWDADYIYVCTATDTWKRTAITTW